MNNFSIFTADRTTHLKIVVVSLIASIAVLAVGISARVDGAATGVPASGTIVKATSRPMLATRDADLTIR